MRTKIVVFLTTILIFSCVFFLSPVSANDDGPKKPNIIFILADDMGIGDLGCYGQEKIKTPVLDGIAAEGIRFTQGYCGTSVCAPSRASLMTGLDSGHCPIRANREIRPEGQKPLPEGTYTVAKLMKENGYATLCAGKWGMGMFDTTGSPLKMGFDDFYGYNCQRHAHKYFPEYLYENDKKVELDGKTFGPEVIYQNTLKWIRSHKNDPFFIFYSTTLPHTPYNAIDDLGIYKDKTDWTDEQRGYAALCTRLDSQVGGILSLLKELDLDDNTIVFFAGDNGAPRPPREPNSIFFGSSGGLRDHKRSMYEGALRNAFLVRWPDHIKPKQVCDTPIAFWDFLPTCAELAGGKLPEGVPTDGVSLVPLLLEGKKPDRDTFYWELHEGKPSLQAVRWKDWKFVRKGPGAAIELYDLKLDPGEKNNIAGDHPELIEKGGEMMDNGRIEHPDWPLKDR